MAEAVIALGIIATGVLAMAGLALRTTDVVVRARHRTVAAQLADAGLTEFAARGVAASSPACLLRDVAGCVEYRDASRPGGRRARRRPSRVRWYAAAVRGQPGAGDDPHGVRSARAGTRARHRVRPAPARRGC